MEIFTILDTLEDLIDNGKKVPLTGKCVVDQDEILELIKEIRLKFPDELKQAKWVKEEREKILAEAQKEADDIVKEAEARIIAMIDEHEITKKAYEEKDKLISAANDKSRQITQGAREYADNILGSLSKQLEQTLRQIEEDRKELN